jgi:phosphoribulokinase
LREAGKIYDLKIFMKPSEELRRYWKVERDVKKRGYAIEKVLEAIEKRLPDAASHILSQESEADIIFSIEVDKSKKQTNQSDEKQLCLKITCANDVYFEHLVDHLSKSPLLHVQHEIDRNRQVIIICGVITKEIVEETAEVLEMDIEDIIGAKPLWCEGLGGTMQLFVAYTILNQFKRTGMLISAETFINA